MQVTIGEFLVKEENGSIIVEHIGRADKVLAVIPSSSNKIKVSAVSLGEQKSEHKVEWQQIQSCGNVTADIVDMNGKRR